MNLKSKLTLLLRYAWYTREAWIWTTALVFLALNTPSGNHYSFCLFHNIGIPFCPGCGIGRSITLFFHGDFHGSFMCHPLGIPAVILLISRIYSILRKQVNYSEILKTSLS